TTRFCLVGKFTHLTNNDNFLVMTAKPKSFTDVFNKTTEYYLQVEPSNDVANQNDCLTYNLSNALYANAVTPTLNFSLSQLCASCSTAVSSQPLRLFFVNGEEVPVFSLGTMFMTISGSSDSTGNACVENTICKARGYDCCLQGQCVTDGA